MKPIIYLDNNATTKIDPKVLDAMMPSLTDEFANASSGHYFGLRIKRSVEDAKIKVADLINADPRQLIFTSGATEAINLVLKGVAASSLSEKKHIITLETEHKAVLDTCKYLESTGFDISYLPVQKDGLLDLDILRRAIRKDTLLVSVMWVNNETGVIQDIPSINKICLEASVLFMTDATQAAGKLPIDVSQINVDFLTLSGHKFYGPKGAGVLYFSKSGKHYLSPLIHGGGHEEGLRSGTLNTPAIIGLGKAAEIAGEEMEKNETTVRELRDKLEAALLSIEGASVNGNIERRIYNVTNLCFKNIESDVLIGKLKNFAISNGSACTSLIVEPSHVLKAMGLSDNEASGSVRFSLGKFNTSDEIDFSISEFQYQIKQLQYNPI